MQNKIEYEEFFRSQICCFEKSIENDSMKFLSAAIVIKYSARNSEYRQKECSCLHTIAEHSSHLSSYCSSISINLSVVKATVYNMAKCHFHFNHTYVRSSISFS